MILARYDPCTALEYLSKSFEVMIQTFRCMKVSWMLFSRYVLELMISVRYPGTVWDYGILTFCALGDRD